MYSIEDIQQSIQEWFYDASDSKETAKTYHEILAETEKQMEHRFDCLCEFLCEKCALNENEGS